MSKVLVSILNTEKREKRRNRKRKRNNNAHAW
jgi:hypothetical protein